MATGVVGFRPVESVANVLAALHSTTHNGFPIAFTPEGGDAGPIVRSCLNHGAAGSHGSLVSLAQLGAMQERMLQGTPTPEPGSPGLAPPVPAAAMGEVTAAAAAAVVGAAPAAAAGGSPVPAGAVGGGVVASCEGGRLEGVILRSQLLVLLQRRHFCDQHGRPVGREYNEKEEIDLEVSAGAQQQPWTACSWFDVAYFQLVIGKDKHAHAVADARQQVASDWKAVSTPCVRIAAHLAYSCSCLCLCCPLRRMQTEMRTFFRRYFTHNRYVSATATPLEALQLQNGSVDLSSLFIDMRPYMNRSPFTVRRDCSASRAHQVGSRAHHKASGLSQCVCTRMLRDDAVAYASC